MSVEKRYAPLGMSVPRSDYKLPMIVGYAAVFNSLSQEMEFKDGRRFREMMKPGAFTESLRSRADVIAVYNHNWHALLGRVSNGTLRLQEDQRGLRYEIDPPNTQTGRDVVALIRRRDVPYSSFAFNIAKGGDSWRRNGNELIREIRSVQLIDVSPVDKPAYMATEVALKSFEASPIGLREMQMRLRMAEASLR